MPRIPPEANQSPPPNRAAAGELKTRRGPADSGSNRARQLPQQLPRALTVLVCSTFDYPELSFLHTAGDPNATAAINAGDLDSGYPSPEHRHW